MKFVTFAILLAAVPCLFTVVQAEPCGGGPIEIAESDALRAIGGALYRLYFTIPINNSMSACFCYVADKRDAWGPCAPRVITVITVLRTSSSIAEKQSERSRLMSVLDRRLGATILVSRASRWSITGNKTIESSFTSLSTPSFFFFGLQRQKPCRSFPVPE